MKIEISYNSKDKLQIIAEDSQITKDVLDIMEQAVNLTGEFMLDVAKILRSVIK